MAEIHYILPNILGSLRKSLAKRHYTGTKTAKFKAWLEKLLQLPANCGEKQQALLFASKKSALEFCACNCLRWHVSAQSI